MFRARAVTAVGLSLFAASLTAVSGASASGAPRLDVYAGDLSRADLAKIVALGVDRQELALSKARGKDAIHVETVLSANQVR